MIKFIKFYKRIIKKIKRKIVKLVNIKEPWDSIKNTDYSLLLEKYPNNKVLKKDFSLVYITHISFDKFEIDSIKKASIELNIKLHIFDIFDDALINKIINTNPDCILVRPTHENPFIRQIFIEKICILRSLIKIPIYPSQLEDLIYESKRSLFYFLSNMNIPHPETKVLYSERDAMDYIRDKSYPLIFKQNVGSAASGVYIIKNNYEAEKYIYKSFHNGIENKHSKYKDKSYIIIQEYIKEVKEYRIIKIGKSWFGHEKIINNNFHSGSGSNAWTPPTKDILNFCNKIALDYNFNTINFDIFKTNNGDLLINELQAWFGSYNPSQMYIKNIPGRYIFKNNNWIFEEGLFNRNGGFNLRIEELYNNIYT